jgi:D-amino peptidase
MKYLIGVDLEGVSCVVGEPNMTLTGSSGYEFARIQATREANAAARALFDSGAEQVIVWDNHGGGNSLIYDDLDERCDILNGSGAKHRWAPLDKNFAGVLLIGYHAKDNTQNSVLAHTYNSKEYQWIKINNVEVGEMAVDAAVAGELGVPVIFVSSDAEGVKEAKDFLPWVEAVSTKQGLGRNMALSKHPKRVLDEIYEGTKKAVVRLSNMKTFAFESPMTLEIRFKRLEGAQQKANERMSFWTVKDPYSVECKFNKISDFF